MFDRLRVIRPTGYQRGSLGKKHLNGNFLIQYKQCQTIVFPQDSNLQPLDYRSTALSLELETIA